RDVSSLRRVVIRGAIFNIEDPVWRRSTGRGENPQICAGVTGTWTGTLIRPIGGDCVGCASYWYAGYAEVVVGRPKGKVTVRANLHRRESCVIKSVRKRKVNRRG